MFYLVLYKISEDAELEYTVTTESDMPGIVMASYPLLLNDEEVMVLRTLLELDDVLGGDSRIALLIDDVAHSCFNLGQEHPAAEAED